MKKILLISLCTLSLFGLTLDEAVERAMKNSPGLKEKELLYQASEEETAIARSGFRPTLDLTYGYSQFSKKSYVGANSASSADAAINYNLFNGFSDTFNLKGNEEDAKAAQYTRDAAKADLRLQVYLAYIDYLRSQEQITVSEKTIRLLEQQLHDAKNFYEQGLFAKNDFLQVHVELSSARQALLSSKRNTKISFYRLKRLLGSELHEYESVETLVREEKELVIPVLQKKMYANRSELRFLDAQQKGLEYAYEGAVSNYYPKIDLQAKYQVAGEDPIPNGGATFQTHDQTTLSVNLSWNLYRGGADEARRASLLDQKNASAERIRSLYLELDFQLEQAMTAYELARNQIKVAAKALEQAKENFRITKDQFDANIANTSLMLDAQRFLARIEVDYYSAYFALYDAMGEIERVVEEEVF